MQGIKLLQRKKPSHGDLSTRLISRPSRFARRPHVRRQQRARAMHPLHSANYAPKEMRRLSHVRDTGLTRTEKTGLNLASWGHSLSGTLIAVDYRQILEGVRYVVQPGSVEWEGQCSENDIPSGQVCVAGLRAHPAVQPSARRLIRAMVSRLDRRSLEYVPQIPRHDRKRSPVAAGL